MKSTTLKFAVLVSIAIALIGCASQPAMTTGSTATTGKAQGPLERGNGLASVMH